MRYRVPIYDTPKRKKRLKLEWRCTYTCTFSKFLTLKKRNLLKRNL